MRCCSHQALPSCVVPFLSPVWALHALMRWCLGVAACRGTAVPVLLRYQSGLWSPRAGCSKRDFTAWWKEITSQWTSAGIGCGLLIFRGRLIPKRSCAVSTDLLTLLAAVLLQSEQVPTAGFVTISCVLVETTYLCIYRTSELLISSLSIQRHSIQRMLTLCEAH